MARKRMYAKWDIPLSVVALVNAIVADYERRLIAIERASLPAEIINRYKELNLVVENALNDIEPGARKEMVRDISEGRGYHKSGMQIILSKNAYYRRRKKLVHDIAKGLYLL